MAVIAAAPPVLAQTGPPPDSVSAQQLPPRIKDLSLEELLDIDVTLPARRSERVQDVPAAISVVTAEDVRRSGATTLTEALRLLPGLFVGGFSATSWIVTSRGFASTGGNKLLVMIDGRSVYSPLFSGVFWDQQDSFLPDVERIELIRGPGATLWGANAVNGVLNIVTRSAADTVGDIAFVTAGTEDNVGGGVRHGGRLGRRGAYRIYGKYADRDEARLTTGQDAGDWRRFGQAGFRVDGGALGGALTLQGDTFVGRFGLAGRADAEIAGGNLLGRWFRRMGPDSELQVQFYYDRTYRFVPLQVRERRGTYDLDVQHRVRIGSHDLLWGGGYRVSRDDTTPSALIRFEPEDRTTDLVNGFVQDDLAVGERLHVTVGAKIEGNDYTGGELQPSARVRWIPTGRQTVWGAVSRAVRMPTRFDADLRVLAPTGAVAIRGSEDFRSEVLVAWEAGYRVVPAAVLSLDVAAFVNRYDDVRSQELPLEPGPVVVGNGFEADSSGVETTVTWTPHPGLRVVAAHAYLDLDLRRTPGSRDITGGVVEANDPRHQLWMHGRVNLPRDLEFDVNVRRIGELPVPGTPAYAEADLRLGWHASPRLELSLVGRNLLHDGHVEFASPTSPFRVVALERRVSAAVRFAF